MSCVLKTALFFCFCCFLCRGVVCPVRRMADAHLPSAASIWDGTAAQWTENILAESFCGKGLPLQRRGAANRPEAAISKTAAFTEKTGFCRTCRTRTKPLLPITCRRCRHIPPKPPRPAIFCCRLPPRRLRSKNPQLGAGIPVQSKLYIQRCYSSLSSFRTIDAYNGLFSHQSEYLFTAQILASPHWAAIICTSAPGKSWAIPPVPWTILHLPPDA